VIGQVIGNYEIVAELGQGGMGTVYRAEHVKDRRLVAAVKILAKSADRNAMQRFFDEAAAAGRIEHASTVKVLDVGTLDDGRAYLIMELLRGEALAARIQTGPLTIEATLDVAIQIASALAATHRAGIVHRDLKPENLFLVRDHGHSIGERVRVLDFGIAKLDDSPHETRGAMGTPLYMAPEQWRNAADVDARSDIYALGCVIYAMLVGRPPFEGESVGALCAAHLQQIAPSLAEARPEVPSGLEMLVNEMLAKKLDDRPQDMSEVRDRLAAVASGEAADDAPLELVPKRIGVTVIQNATLALPKPRRGWLIGGAIIGLAIVGLAVALAVRRDDASLPALSIVLPSEPEIVEAEWIRIPSREFHLGVSIKDLHNGYPKSGIEEYRWRKRSFELQDREVTWVEIDRWLADVPSERRPELPTHPANELRAAMGIPFAVANSYCTHFGFRLPTEFEWEVAARGPGHVHLPWDTGNPEIDHRRRGEQAVPPELKIGYRGPNAVSDVPKTSKLDRTGDGLHDMLGNVQEWTSTEWEEIKNMLPRTRL
jgi:formylglycine-generating enzyme required for sulfatase activity